MVASDSSNRKRATMLGMPFGTAAGRLRKSIIMNLAQKLGLDNCFKCGELIDSLEDWSIEHKQSWYRANNPKESFFDLDNIAFSHIKCNVPDNHTSTRIVVPEGMAWCTYGKHVQPINLFHKDRNRWTGLHKDCDPCFYEARKSYPSRRVSASAGTGRTG